MDGQNRTGSPLEMAAGAASQRTVGAFKLVGNETRLSILLALWEAYEPHADTDAVGFSELRKRVGVRTGAQFNYHLDKLVGVFAEKAEEGYRLRPVGRKLVQTLIAGTGLDAALPSSELDCPCSLCGARTAITYRDGWLYHVCTECEGGIGGDSAYPDGTLFAEPFPPAALSNRSPEEIFAAGVFRLFQVMTMKMGGVCPRCSSVVERSVHVCRDHRVPDGQRCPNCGNVSRTRVRWTCSVCKYEGSSSPGTAVVVHPTVQSFYHDHGIDVGSEVNDYESSKRLLQLSRETDHELVSEEPLRIRVAVPCEDETLRLTLDGDLAVTESERTSRE